MESKVSRLWSEKRTSGDVRLHPNSAPAAVICGGSTVSEYFLIVDLNTLHLGKDLIEDAFIAKECRGGFLPAAEFVDRE